MTAASPAFTPLATELGVAERRALRDARIRGAIFAVVGLISFALASGLMEAPSTFSFWIDKQGGDSFTWETTSGLLWILTGVAFGAVGILQLVRGASFQWRRALLPLLALLITATLGTLLDGKVANLTGVFRGTLELATPITLGAFAGILSERSGMLNIAIEGKFLIGACTAAIVASVTDNALIGVLAAVVAGAGVGLLLAWLGIRHGVDQIISGVVVNIGALGITNFLFLRVLSKNTELNTPPSIEAIKVPLLSEIPIIGPILFSGTPYLYFTIGLMIFFWYMLFRSKWGLRLRASGEKPSAAGTVGIDVLAIRYRAMMMAGMVAAIAGSYLSLSSAGSFQMNMSAGRGFIALAAMIFGAWHPVYAFGAALVFGFSDATQALLSILGVDVPPQLLNSVPYIVTIIVVAGVVGRVRGPAAAGQPYIQG
ncbi:MAG: ABC transporter permease [Chloroflexota bacterium]|nr:ABC transporter permease [Chloroflexota bacterium]